MVTQSILWLKCRQTIKPIKWLWKLPRVGNMPSAYTTVCLVSSLFQAQTCFFNTPYRDYAKRNVVKQCYFHILSYFWMWLISILLEFVLHWGKFCFCIFFYSKLTLAQHRNEEGGWLNYSLTEIENNVWLLYKSVCFNRVPVPKLLWIMTTSISPQQRPRYVKYCQCEPLTKS